MSENVILVLSNPPVFSRRLPGGKKGRHMQALPKKWVFLLDEGVPGKVRGIPRGQAKISWICLEIGWQVWLYFIVLSFCLYHSVSSVGLAVYS